MRNEKDKNEMKVDPDYAEISAPVEGSNGDYTVHTARAHDIIARILCALAAIVLWLYVMSIDAPEWEKTLTGVLVEIENETQLAENHNMSVIDGYNNTVSVTIKGKKSDVDKCTAADLRAYVDLLGVEESGKHQLSITALADAGFTVVDVSPQTIWVYTDRIATKRVKVDVRLYYQIAANLGLGATETNIQEVTVTGPADVLETISSARAELDLGQITTSMTQRAQLVLVDENGDPITNPYVKSDTSDILVTVPVYAYKTVPVTVDFKYGYLNSDNANVSVTPSQITVRGDPQILETFNEYRLIELDETKIAGDYSQLVKLALPDGIIDADKIGNVTIEITHIGTSTKSLTMQSIDLDVIAPEDLIYSFDEDIFNFTVRAPDTLINRINSSHMRVSIDLTHYDQLTGYVTVPVTITTSISSFTGKVYAVGTYNVQVKLGE